MSSNSGSWKFFSGLVLLGLAVMPLGCGGSKSDTKEKEEKAASQAALKVEFPDGDPSVPADQGGPGFTGEGWTTAVPVYSGDPKAVKGGTVTTFMLEWLSTLRVAGPSSNVKDNSTIYSLCYQTLLDLDPNNLEFVPSLASHWWISEDKMTFRFRINPKAHWSDGKPVVAEDVVATYKLLMDETLEDPMNILVYGKLHPPVAKSKYIVEVKAKDQNWRNFLYFAASTLVLPAHEIGPITGKEYLEKYNFAYTAVSGPYQVRPEDIKKGNSLTLTRRDDFWAKDDKANVGLYNFDKIRFVVVRDPELAFQKVCKGELDYFQVIKPEWWVNDLPALPAVKRGWLIRKEIYNDNAVGVRGFAINMRVPPLDDVRVRKALALLYDRETLMKKLWYGLVKPLDSYYQGGEYQNHDNELIRYDPKKAADLLAEAGWKERGPDGILVKDGKPLRLTMTWFNPLSERFLTSYKETCKQVGVDIVLDRTTFETMFKNIDERKFELATVAWTGLTFPNPETSYQGKLADQPANNNIVGFKDARVDELLGKYDLAFTQQERSDIIREIDGIIFKTFPYVLQWYDPALRIVYWNKFGMPEYGLPRYSDIDSLLRMWWIDPEKSEALKEARRKEADLPIPPLKNEYWMEFKAKQDQASKGN
ncbi:MAG: extracellular solute-binding protein [Planctomycetota bacterium]